LVPVSADLPSESSAETRPVAALPDLPAISTRVLELDLVGDRAQIRAASTEQAIGALLAALREVSTADAAEHTPPSDR
jgi:hypothetical protein